MSKAEMMAMHMQTGAWYDKDLFAIARHASSSESLYCFIFAFQQLCANSKSTHGKASKELRAYAWQQLDKNNNGLVSLAETGGWIQERLINFFNDGDNKEIGINKEAAVALYKRFYPCFIRAFLDAADYGEPTKIKMSAKYSTTKTTGDDYVQFGEFRLLVTYLCLYATIWEAFARIDGEGNNATADASDDRRLAAKEWAKASNGMAGHPFKSLSLSGNADSDEVFSKMDLDGKGMVLLAEFSTYIEDYETALKTRWGKLLNAGE